MDFITLNNKDRKTLIKDIVMFPLKINKDESGILVETLRSDWQNVYGKEREFAMQYYSITPSGVARDEKVWHYHPTQEDRFEVVHGSIIVAVADNRPTSETFGLLNLFHMQAQEQPYMLLIPKKTLHGFMAVSKSEAVLINFPTKLYNTEEEQRIPYEKAKVKLPDGSLFLWEKVRREL